MKRFKGTNGNWKIGVSKSVGNSNEYPTSLAVFQEGGDFEKEGKGDCVCLISPLTKLDEFDKANAQLIATAPQLLDVLITMVEEGEDMLGKDGNGWGALIYAKELIKKATTFTYEI